MTDHRRQDRGPPAGARRVPPLAPRAPLAGRRRPAAGHAPAHAGPAAGGSGACSRRRHHLVHVAGTGARRAAISRGPVRACRRRSASTRPRSVTSSSSAAARRRRPDVPPADAIDEGVRRMLASMTVQPAYVTGWRWDLTGVEPGVGRRLRRLRPLPGRRAQYHAPGLRQSEPIARLLLDWELAAPVTLATFRADTASYAGHPDLDRLIATLAAARAPNSATGGRATRCWCRWPATSASTTPRWAA